MGMMPLTPEKLRIWFWIAAIANFLSIGYTLHPGFGRSDDELPMEFYVAVFSLVTLVGIPRVVICGAVYQKVVALCLAVVPALMLFVVVPAFLRICRT
jgi:hypothetical protein